MVDYKMKTLVPENYDESHAHIPVLCNFDCEDNCPLNAPDSFIIYGSEKDSKVKISAQTKFN